MSFAAETIFDSDIPQCQNSSITLVTQRPNTLRKHFKISPVADIDTTVDSTPSSWLSKSILRLTALTVLEENWDGKGGLQIETAMLKSAADLLISIANRSHDANIVLPTPHAAPLPSGALQLEWRAYKRYLELEFVTPDSVRAVVQKGTSIRSLGIISLVKPKLHRVLDFIS